MAVKTVPGGGGSPGLHKRSEEAWGDRRVRPGASSDGLGLDGLGAASPTQRKASGSPKGLALLDQLAWD